MRPPLISVILPVYNVAEYLDKCLESIIAQSYSNLEIILVDDGATDNSPEICDYYANVDERVVVYHKMNGGLSDARNYGIARANGEYITCVDSDDFVDHDYVEYLYDILKKYNTRMSICQHRVVFTSGKIIDYGKRGSEMLSCERCIERMLYHDVIDTSAWAKLYHKDLFADVRYPKGKLFEDIGTTYKLFLLSGEIAIGYEAKYNYIVRSSSIVNAKFNIRKLDLLEMTDQMALDVYHKYPRLRSAIIRRQVYARLSTLNQMSEINDLDETKKKLINYILSNKKTVINNQYAPKRDKLAIMLLNVGYYLYKYAWSIYKRINRS